MTDIVLRQHSPVLVHGPGLVRYRMPTALIMEPKVSKRDKKLQLSYNSSNRLHSAYEHAQHSPNGSAVILLAHDNGLRIIWRGGEPTESAGGKSEDTLDEDPDRPYPAVIEKIEVDLQCAVLHLSVPSLTGFRRVPQILEESIIAALVCADGSLRVLCIPLMLPADDDKDDYVRYIIERMLHLPSNRGSYARALATKFFLPDEFTTTHSSTDQEALATLAVAGASDWLSIHWLSIFDERIEIASGRSITGAYLPSIATSLHWHPSSRRSEILLGDSSGAVRIFDPFAIPSRSRPTSRDSTRSASASDGRIPGRWLLSFFSPVASTTGSTCVHRKAVLSARWILAGAAVVALLDDGEWIIWDISTSTQSSQGVSAPAVRGYLGSVAGSEATEPRQRKGGSKLAPMTPNTRKAKAENLFSGPVKVAGVAASGGISVVTATNNKSSHVDESAILWCNGEIYSIPSIATFWQRSSNQGGSTSLHAPSLALVSDVNLMNEDVTSICQIGPGPSSGNFGVMNTIRDLLISTERRMIILQSTILRTPPKVLFQQAIERPVSRDQRMLDVGELDLGGMDRMLDTLANGDVAKLTRKVGFAH